MKRIRPGAVGLPRLLAPVFLMLGLLMRAPVAPAQLAQAEPPKTVSSQAVSPQTESPQTEAPHTESPGGRAYSADGLYNLANSYERAGKPGMAILNYERAALLAPNDPDISANLSSVRVAGGLSVAPATWFERTVLLLSPWVAAWLALFGLIVIAASVLCARGVAQLRRWRRIGVLVGLLFIGMTVAQGIVMWPRLQRAIVLVADAPVRATPAPLGDTLFTLPEGSAVQMLGEHQDFVFVQIKPGARGWIARASIATVLP